VRAFRTDSAQGEARGTDCKDKAMANGLIKSSVAASLLAVASLSAQAADMRLNARPPATFNWGGCSLGGSLGYAWGRDFDHETVTASGLLTGTSPTDSANPNGVKLGGYLGCNWQLSGLWVIGAEGDLEWANLRGTTTFPNTGPPSDFYDTHIDDQSSIRGRVGYLLEPRLLIFATAGVAFASIKEHDVLAATGAFTDNSTTRTGWTAGAGLDYALTDRWIGRFDYRYANFGTFSYNTAVFGPPLVTESHKTTENAFRIGLAYKFW
jgi:outer membrane immunogenic protein